MRGITYRWQDSERRTPRPPHKRSGKARRLHVCGIFGIVSPDRQDLVRRLRGLFLLSESRGKEAAGLALIDGGAISVLKQPTAASQLVRQHSYLSLLKSVCANPRGGPVTVIGHSRPAHKGR